MDFNKYNFNNEEKIIAEGIYFARRVQEFLWGRISLRSENADYVTDRAIWESIFQKRVDKIREIDLSNKNGMVELRKRILQQAALSIAALSIIFKVDISKVQLNIDTEYELVPFGSIEDEARAIAVRWVENFKPGGGIDLESKHKLASDFMNYATLVSKDKDKEIEELKSKLKDSIPRSVAFNIANKFYGSDYPLQHEQFNKAAESYGY